MKPAAQLGELKMRQSSEKSVQQHSIIQTGYQFCGGFRRERRDTDWGILIV